MTIHEPIIETRPQQPEAAMPQSAMPALLTADDLADLMASFNEVTAKLESTHEKLRAEVVRLNAELRRANAQLERSKRLAALGEMAAGIAHEVRNPLGSISLYTRMLQQDLEDRPEQKGVAIKIAGAVRRLDAVVGDVLTFAREIRLRACPLEAAQVLIEAAEACQGEHTIRARIDGDGQEFEADGSLLHQALINLVRNAAEACAEEGAPVEIDLTARGERDTDGDEIVVLAVRDRGPGIDPAVVERMFNPFFTTRAAGTGLGLAIVHRIADAHGGRVVVFNNADRGGGAGATVELHLPRHAAPRPDRGTDTGATHAPTGEMEHAA